MGDSTGETVILPCYRQCTEFWVQVFYPFVLFYMIAAFLQGGAGTASMGMLNNLRQYLWIPITQDAYRLAPGPDPSPVLVCTQHE